MRITSAVAVEEEPDHVTRLIHRGTLGLEASVAGLAERYGRGKTSHTLHVWWARRPHNAMRSLVYETACTILTSETEATAVALAAGASDAATIRSAQQTLRSSYGSHSPMILDMFGGGGTIPYEAALLGACSHSIDYNSLAVFIQKTNLEWSQQAFAARPKRHVVELVRQSGIDLLTRVKDRTEDIYSRQADGSGAVSFAYFWTYQRACHSCGYRYHLIRRPWLSKKAGRTVGLKARAGDEVETIEIVSDPALGEFPGWQNGRTNACPKCSTNVAATTADATDVIVAEGRLAKPRGKVFAAATPRSTPDQSYLRSRIDQLTSDLGLDIPSTLLPRWSGIVNPALYGIEQHSDIFNLRQTVVVLELAKALREAHAELAAAETESVANYVVAALSGLIDQYVDWNCRLSMWISQNEQVGRAFCGPGVSMLWDYVETDALLKGPANLWDKLTRIVAAVEGTPEFLNRPVVVEGRAQALPWSDDTFDAIVTDPPYYDNMFYNVLSDFIYSWKRWALLPIFPERFAKEQTSSRDELVASTIRQGSAKAAHQWYCDALGQALKEAARVLKPDGVLSFVYGHSSLMGWEAIARCFRASGLYVDTVEPLSIERRQRPRAMTSEAVNTCIVLVARKCAHPLVQISLDELFRLLRQHIADYGQRLKEAGWADEDVGMAVFSKAVAHVANAAGVPDLTDAEALERCAAVVAQEVPGFKVSNRRPL